MSLFDSFIKTIPSGAADCLITFQKIVDFITPKIGSDAVSVTNTKWFQRLSKFVPLGACFYLLFLIILPAFILWIKGPETLTNNGMAAASFGMLVNGIVFLVTLWEVIRYSFYVLAFKIFKREHRVFFIMMGLIPLKSLPWILLIWILISIFA